MQLKIKNGNTWEAIPAGGVGVPSGGNTGQILIKNSDTSYDAAWTSFYGVVLSDTEPAEDYINGWIDSSGTDTVTLPQIDDTQPSSNDTYSSLKIDSTYLAYDKSQTLTSTQKTTAASNIGFQSGSGYCKMPDGTIIQWGKEEVTRNAGQNFATVDFTLEFSATPYVLCNYVTGHPEIWLASVYNYSTTSAQLVLYNTGSTTTGNGSLFWIAIGR